MTGANTAEGLAERIQGVAFGGLTADALHCAKVAVLDIVGRTVASAHEHCARIIAQGAGYGRSGGARPALGTNRRGGRDPENPLPTDLMQGSAR